jgi:hypothetical protein
LPRPSRWPSALHDKEDQSERGPPLTEPSPEQALCVSGSPRRCLTYLPKVHSGRALALLPVAGMAWALSTGCPGRDRAGEPAAALPCVAGSAAAPPIDAAPLARDASAALEEDPEREAPWHLVEPDGSAPVVAIVRFDMKHHGTEFEIRGFPAVSEDGAKVVIANLERPGESDLPQLTVSIKTAATDAEEFGPLVIGPHAFAARAMDLRGELPPRDTTGERIERMNARLEAIDWEPLRAFEPKPTMPSGGERHVPAQRVVLGRGFEVLYKEPRLRVLRDGGVLLDKAFPSWRAGAPAVDVSCVGSVPGGIERVYADGKPRTLVLEIHYVEASDVCEPGPTWHVVPLP